ncbi:MAG: 50S ribosomal protein L32e [Candidatus Hodarchaeota archaeon]
MKRSKRIEKLKQALRQKRVQNQRKPQFQRPESSRYKRLNTSWRRPKGIDSAIRKREKSQPAIPTIGYRSPVALRDYHPSGLKEVLVHNLKELEGLHPKTHAVRIAHRVGDRKRLAIIERADDLGLHVLNPQLKSEVRELLDLSTEETL